MFIPHVVWSWHKCRSSIALGKSTIFAPSHKPDWAWSELQVCLHRPVPSVPDECETAFQQVPAVNVSENGRCLPSSADSYRKHDNLPMTLGVISQFSDTPKGMSFDLVLQKAVGKAWTSQIGCWKLSKHFWDADCCWTHNRWATIRCFIAATAKVDNPKGEWLLRFYFFDWCHVLDTIRHPDVLLVMFPSWAVSPGFPSSSTPFLTEINILETRCREELRMPCLEDSHHPEMDHNGSTMFHV